MEGTKMRTDKILAIGALAAITLVASAGDVVSWNSAVSGEWNLASNWDSMMVPTMSDNVFLEHLGMYSVLVRGEASVSTLNITNPDVQLNLNFASTLTLYGDLNNEGRVRVNPVSGGSETSLHFGADASISGSGSIVLSGFGPRSQITADEGVVVWHGSMHTIEGEGQIEAFLINNGLVSANSVATVLSLIDQDKINNSVMQAVDGAVLRVSGITVNQFVDVNRGMGAYSGLIVADGLDSMIQLAGCTIVGGQLMTINRAIAVVSCATMFDDVDFTGDLDVLSSHRLIIHEGTTCVGQIVINPVNGEAVTSLEWGDNMILEGDGTIFLSGTGARSQLSAGIDVTQGGIGSGMRLEGAGQIDLDFVNNGTIAPGLSLGTMRATQPVLFTDTARFEVEVNQIQSDLFLSVSTVELGGLLEVEFIDGYVPEGYWSRTIIEASAINGAFDSIVIPPAPMGLVTRIVNTGTEFIVGHTCPADYTLDGTLNFFDVSAFVDAFNAGDLVADLTGDGILNFFDVSAFITSFTEGCAI